MKLRKVAVFDIDGTIFRSSLLIEVVNALIHEKIFPARAISIYEGAHKKWLERKGNYDEYIHGVIRAFERNIKGVSETDFMRVASLAVSANQNRVYRYTRDLVKTLAKKHYYLLAISHSPKMIVDAFAKRLGFSKVYGLMYEIVHQRRISPRGGWASGARRGRKKEAQFTGKVLYADVVFDKASILRRAVVKENLTLKGSIGVGDTESDISFLKMVERPICFNPNRKLYAHAKRSGWEIVVERKDMVYTIEKGKITT